METAVKPAPFDYVAATSVDHALALLGGGADAKVIAGGQSLLPVLNMRLAAPELVVDIGRLDELGALGVDPDGSLVVGAAVTQTEALDDPALRDGWPMLHAAIANIGHPQIRNRGTVCGSLAHNDPAAELPAVALALDVSVRVGSTAGERMVPAEELFVGPFMTSLEPHELLLAAVFPPQPAEAGWSFREFAARPGDFATVGLAVRLIRRDDAIAEARVAVFGVGGTARRATAVERALVGSVGPSVAETVHAALDAEIEPTADIHASAATRRDLTHGLLAEAVDDAWERCS